MKHYLRNITMNQPRMLLHSTIASILDACAKMIPAILLIGIIQVLYAYHFHGGNFPTSALWLYTVLLIISLFLQWITYRYAYHTTYYTAYDVAAKGRINFAERLRKIPLGFFDRRDPADLSNLLLQDYMQVEHTISHNIPQAISALIFPCIAFLGLTWIDWRMAVAMFITVPIAIIIIICTDRIQAQLSERHAQAKNDTASRLQEYLLGMQELKLHQMVGGRFNRLKRAFEEQKDAAIHLESKMGSIIISAILFMRSGLSIMLLIGSYLLLEGTLTLPVFLLFLLVGTKVYEPLTTAFINYGEMRYSAYSASRIQQVLQYPSLVGQEKIVPTGEIQFNHVSFQYDDEKEALQNITFRVQPNTVTALVGLSGSGKSTILRLLARFDDVTKGDISIGGKSIKQIEPAFIFSAFSFVFQDAYLFKGTIRDNILLGRLNATEEEMIRAAKQANCHTFIEKLPQGYDTMIAESGATLSGGERQRISIARAILKDAPIILLDEATASLDSLNERDVQRAISALTINKTVLTVAHRLQTITSADQILVLEDGKIVERGTHEQLIQKCGLYEKLYHQQVGEIVGD